MKKLLWLVLLALPLLNGCNACGPTYVGGAAPQVQMQPAMYQGYQNDELYLWWLLYANHSMYPSFESSRPLFINEYRTWYRANPGVNLRGAYETKFKSPPPSYMARQQRASGGNLFKSSAPGVSSSRSSSTGFKSSPPSTSSTRSSGSSSMFRSSSPSRSGGRR